MNYKQHDDELIRQARDRKEIDKARVQYTKKKNELENRTYSGEGLNALAKGEYNKLRTNTTNRVPELKPSTKYQNQNIAKSVEQPRMSNRDTSFDNDFNEFHKYRVGDKIGVMDYDSNSDREVEHWRNLKTQIMAKNKWSEQEFDKRWDDYYNERAQKESDQEVSDSIKFAKQHPKLATALQYAYTIPSAIEGGASALRGALSYLPFVSDDFKEKYFPTSADDRAFTNTRAQEGMKQAVKEARNMSKAGEWVYDIATGLPEMASPLIQAGKSAAQGEMGAHERGSDKVKAARTGLAQGGISYGLSKLGLEKAIGSDTLKQAALSEGGEEMLENLLNIGADKLINKDKSQINALHDYYTSQGVDDSTAWLNVAKDLGGETVLSGIIGGVTGGGLHLAGNLPSLAGMLRGRNANTNVSVDANTQVPVVTGDATIDNAIKQTVDAEAEIQRLSEQIPKVPEVVNESAPTLTPEDQAALQAELANEGYDWTDGQGENTPVNTYTGDTSYATPNQYRQIEGKTFVGKATIVPGEYTGSASLPVQSKQNSEHHVISDDIYSRAVNNLNSARSVGEEGVASRLKQAYKTLFGDKDSYNSIVDNLTVEGKPYGVTVYKNIVGKAMGKNASPEKLAVVEDLNSIIHESNWVGSSDNTKGKQGVSRYDYFEKPITVNGKNYLVTYSVEVRPSENKYRTHGIIDEMKIQQFSNGTGNTPNGGLGPGAKTTELSNSSVTPDGGNVNRTMNERAARNPSITSKPLEGAEREAVQSKFNDLSKKLTQKNREIAVQKEIANNAKGKTKTAENKKLKALQAEAKEIQNSKKELRRQLDGKPVPVKEILAEQNKDLHDKIFQRKTGLLDNINYVAKHAGDTAEAKQLAKDVRKAITDYIETGDVNSTLYDRDVIKKINRLDELANTVDAEYIGHFRDNVLFTDEDGNASIWNALEGVGENPGITSQIGRFHDENMRTPDTTSAPTTTSVDPAHELAGRYAAAYQGFDTYDYMDNIFENDSFEESMANDIQNGRDLTGYIDALEEIIDDAPDEGTRAEMQSLIDELTTLNEGRVPTDGQLTPEEVTVLQDAVDGKYDILETGNEIPTVKPTEPTTPERVPEIANENVPPRRSFFDDIPPRSDKEGKSKVGTNTMVNAKIFTEDQINNDPVISELNKYAKANNDRTFTAAKENVLKNGDALLDDYISGRKSLGNDLDVDQAMLLLKGLNDKISYGDTSLEAQRNLLFSKLRQTGTLYGQTIQAFKKWNDTPEGAVINGDRLLDKPTQTWKSNNKKKVELNGRIAKALEQMGMDNSMRNKPKVEKTHEQIRKGVENVLAREYGSVEKYFNDNDIEFLTTLAENKDIPVWQITDEIEHKMNTGSWYTLDESIPEPQGPVNQRLKNALDSLVPREEVVKEPLTFNEIRDQVKNTFNREAASLEGEFDDRDIDYLANMIQDGATKQELAEALNTKLATGRFGISLDTQQKVNDLFEYANRYDPNSKQAIEAKSAAYKLIADEAVMDASPLEKFESWRYLAMLGNPKTMIRNYVGNKMFGAVTGASNNFSAMLEAGTDKLARKLGADGIQRTKAILNPLEDSNLIKAAGNDAEAHRYSQLEGTKYEKGTQNAIRKQKSVFNSKLLRLYERATDAGISDYNAVKKKYSTSLAGYMKANGLDQSAFDADETYRGLQDISKRRVLTDNERATMESYKGIHDQLEKARDYAVKQAEYATFHEDNAIAKFLTEQSQKARNSENGAVRGLGYMLEGLVPFKKTPANILKSGIDYSPLGAIKSIKETGKLIYENTGKRKGNLEDTYTKKNKLTGKEQEVNKSIAADVIDSWSKTLTGTGLLALGYYLKNKGILNSSNKDEKWQDDLEGIQNYSITINGKTYTIDWAAPAVMPLLMGAEMSKIKDRSAMLDTKWYDNLDAVGETINALLDPMFETSMLQGIKDTVEQAAKQVKYDDNGSIGGILGSLAMNTATGYLTQGIPTISGQIARTVDNTRRTTDTATSSPLLEPFEKQGRKIINKIPGLSMLNEAYYDSYGRTQQNGPFNNPIGNLFYQMGSPAYIRDINTTDADKQAREAYYGEGEDGKPIMDSKVFPTWKSTVKVEGQKLSPSEMATYRKTSGEAQYAIRDALTKEDWFKNLDASQQTEILGKVNTLVDKIGKGEAGYPQDSKDLQAYESGGVPSLLSYWNGKIESKRVTEETGLSANTNAVKEINQLLSEGQAEEAEKKIKQAKKDNEARLKLNEKYGVNIKMADYQRREEANPGSNEEWAKEHATKGTQTQTTPKVTTKSEPETNDTKVDTAGYEKYIDRAGGQSKKFTNDIPKLKELNYGKSEMYTYAYAINQDSSLTPQSFNAQYKKLDLDGNGSMKQDEMINYFNKNNTSEKQANYLWRTYGENKGTPWKTLPVLKNGTWKKSK